MKVQSINSFSVKYSDSNKLNVNKTPNHSMPAFGKIAMTPEVQEKMLYFYKNHKTLSKLYERILLIRLIQGNPQGKYTTKIRDFFTNCLLKSVVLEKNFKKPFIRKNPQLV